MTLKSVTVFSLGIGTPFTLYANRGLFFTRRKAIHPGMLRVSCQISDQSETELSNSCKHRQSDIDSISS